MASKNRGKRPAVPAGTLRETAPPPSYNEETPKFCLHYLRNDFDVHALDADGQCAFAKTLQKLAGLRWTEIVTSGRHGHGSEHIPKAQIKPSIPERFQDRERFMVLRYNGLLPMAGVRVDDVYHVLWIEPEFNSLYDHG